MTAEQKHEQNKEFSKAKENIHRNEAVSLLLNGSSGKAKIKF